MQWRLDGVKRIVHGATILESLQWTVVESLGCIEWDAWLAPIDCFHVECRNNRETRGLPTISAEGPAADLAERQA